ncbi:hypothetical protein GCM10028828_14630 [Corynebacterium tapiri]
MGTVWIGEVNLILRSVALTIDLDVSGVEQANAFVLRHRATGIATVKVIRQMRVQGIGQVAGNEIAAKVDRGVPPACTFGPRRKDWIVLVEDVELISA